MTELFLDCKNLLCPLPVIRTQEKIKELTVGDELVVLCTDPGALHDIPAWSRIHGHKVVSVNDDDEVIAIKLKILN